MVVAAMGCRRMRSGFADTQFDVRCEVKLMNVLVPPGKPFSVQVRREQETWMQARMALEKLCCPDLRPLDNPLSEISFERVSTRGKVGAMTPSYVYMTLTA